MEELFVPHPIAVLARNKGFKEGCLAFYDKEGEFNFIQQSPEDGGIKNPILGGGSTAPIYQQLVEWFEDEYKIVIVADYFKNYTGEYSWRGGHKRLKDSTIIFAPNQFLGQTKKMALNNALKQAFKFIP